MIVHPFAVSCKVECPFFFKPLPPEKEGRGTLLPFDSPMQPKASIPLKSFWDRCSSNPRFPWQPSCWSSRYRCPWRWTFWLSHCGFHRSPDGNKSVHLVMGTDSYKQGWLVLDHGKHDTTIIGYRDCPKILQLTGQFVILQLRIKWIFTELLKFCLIVS